MAALQQAVGGAGANEARRRAETRSREEERRRREAHVREAELLRSEAEGAGPQRRTLVLAALAALLAMGAVGSWLALRPRARGVAAVSHAPPPGATEATAPPAPPPRPVAAAQQIPAPEPTPAPTRAPLAATGLRQVDFLNGRRLPAVESEYCRQPLSHATLAGGRAELRDCELSVRPPSFGDITGDGREEAAIAVKCNSTVGNSGDSFVFLFGQTSAGDTQVLAKFHFRGRESEDVSSPPVLRAGQLVFETDVWDTEDAACCPSQKARHVYVWSGGRLQRRR